MGVGVINCANEINTQTCREYEIAGYPMLKLFPPNSPTSNVGDVLAAHDIPALTKGMADWIAKTESEAENHHMLEIMPDLTSLRYVHFCRVGCLLLYGVLC